ncbi:MAG: hypothetical protein ACRDG3_01975 [Tepidiformaceae bacterium]
MGTAPTRIITYTSEDGRFDKVAAVARKAAAAAGATIIYYDIDAAGIMGSPHPTFWSADNDTAVGRGLLDSKELDTAGRHAVAKCVAASRRDGVEAYGWLPDSPGVDALADFADSQHADLVVVPEELAEPNLLDRLRGRSLQDIEDKTGRPVTVVNQDGVTVADR